VQETLDGLRQHGATRYHNESHFAPERGFVASDYPLRERFARLTQQEERAGLYEEPKLIGTKAGWEEVLRQRGVRLSGHRVVRIS
jgi:hypothetical protein